MKNLKFVVSLTAHDNDYQMEQTASTKEAAHRRGMDIEILHAENAAILQSQQLFIRTASSSNRWNRRALRLEVHRRLGRK